MKSLGYLICAALLRIARPPSCNLTGKRFQIWLAVQVDPDCEPLLVSCEWFDLLKLLTQYGDGRLRCISAIDPLVDPRLDHFLACLAVEDHERHLKFSGK